MNPERTIDKNIADFTAKLEKAYTHKVSQEIQDEAERVLAECSGNRFAISALRYVQERIQVK